MVRHDSRNTGYTNETVPEELELLWRYEPRGEWDRLVTSVLGKIIPEIRMMISTDPLVADGKVFVIFNVKLHALDADTGELIWCYDPPFPCRLCSSIAISDGKVFVSFDKTYALDADTGEIIWSFSGDTIAVVDGKIFVGSQAQDKIYRLDADTGKIIKSYKLKGYNLGAYSLAVADEKVFVFFGA